MAGAYNYTTTDGVTHVGYLSDDNKMYTDPSMTTRIPNGSSVTSSDGKKVWYMTSNGGITIEPGGSGGSAEASSDSFSDPYINDMYNSYTQSKLDALKSAYDQSVLANQTARAGIAGTYNDARNSTASQAAIGQQNFNERAAASGINSGVGSQASLAMNNTLQGNLSNLDKQQAKDTSASDLQLAQLTAKYQSDIASAIAEGKFQAAQAIYNKMLTDTAAARQQSQFDATLGLQKQQLADSEKTTTENRALTAAQISGDFSGMAAFGWSPEMIAGANAAWKTQHTVTPTYSGKSNTDTTNTDTTPNDTNSQWANIDMNSVLALGMGPLSYEGLNKLVEEGKIAMYTENGVIKFKKIQQTPPPSVYPQYPGTSILGKV